MNFNMTLVNIAAKGFIDAIKYRLSHLSAEGTGWLGTMLMHGATIPSTLALLFGVSDNMPAIDVVMFIWFGLFLFFVKALIKRDMLNIITNAVGFFIQAILLAMVVFK